MNALHGIDAGQDPPLGVADAEDLRQLYRALLGREAEPGVFESGDQRPLSDVVAEMAASHEINRQVLHPLVWGQALPHELLDSSQRHALGEWLSHRLGSPSDEDSTTQGEQPDVARLLRRLYRTPGVTGPLFEAHGSLFIQACEELDVRCRRGTLKLEGKIEFANREVISGWLLETTGRLVQPQLEIRLKEDGRLVAHGAAVSFRPDVQRRYGGAGIAGFRAKWDVRALSGRARIELTLHEASTGVPVGEPYAFDNSFVAQLSLAQQLAQEFAAIHQRLDVLSGMVPQALSYCAFPLERYDLYRQAHRIPPPPPLQSRHEVELLVLLDCSDAGAWQVRLSVDSLRNQQGACRWHAWLVGAGGEAQRAVSVQCSADSRFQAATSWQHVHALHATSEDNQQRWIVLLQAGQHLDPQTFAWIAHAGSDDECALVYADEDTLVLDADADLLGRNPEFAAPTIRAPFDPDSLLEANVVGHNMALRADHLIAYLHCLGSDPGAAERALCRTGREQLIWSMFGRGSLVHVPHALWTTLRRRGDGPSDMAATFDMEPAAISPASVQTCLPHTWRGRGWHRVPDPVAPVQGLGFVRWTAQRPEAVLSVLIPTRNGLELLRRCIDSLVSLALRRDSLEIVVADNGSDDAQVIDYLQVQQRAGVCKVIRVEEPFNWSRLNNIMVQAASGDHLLFLNNDTVALTPQWDDILRGLLERDDIGAVGARLFYEDMTLQHAGVQCGYEGFVGHVGVGKRPDAIDGPPGAGRTREVFAVTGAFLACTRNVFAQVGPFDEQQLTVTFNDIDWCMRVRRSGLKILYAPLLSFLHLESKTRGFDFMSSEKQDRARFERYVLMSRYPGQFGRDMHLSPRLSGWVHDSPCLL